MAKRFESYDWLKTIGGILFLAAALLPWWESGYAGIEVRQNGFDDWLGIVATVIFVAIAVLTVIVETESLAIPRRYLDPRWVLGLGIVGSLCVLTRLFFDPFNDGEGVEDSRGFGLYLAAVAAVISMIGCVMAFKRRGEWLASLEVEPDDEAFEPADVLTDYDPDEQDELIRRINTSLERDAVDPPPPRRRGPRPETDQERRRAQREQRAANRGTARRRDSGAPPIP